jgi:hypothetical protein
LKAPTLDEFIAAYGTRKYPPNLHVCEFGFTQLYVRMSRRWIGNAWHDPTLDVANIEARWPGNGYFTRLVKRLRKEHPQMTLYVESVLNQRFRGRLVVLGFTPVGPALDCFVLFP